MGEEVTAVKGPGVAFERPLMALLGVVTIAFAQLL
jgi:hypothetical protein